MHSRHSISLRRRPPPSLRQTQDELLSDGFPPIRERKSSESPIRVPRHRSSAVQKDRTRPRSESPPQLPQHPDTGLGDRSILNTIAVRVRHAQVSIEHFQVVDHYANN